MNSFQQILEECLTALSNGSSTVDECLARYPQYAEELKPLLRTVRFLKLGRNVKPSQAFKTHSRIYLTQHLRFNPRRSRWMLLSRQVTLTVAMLIAALFVTGTVHAQSALPGDNFYSWKRATEEIWRALSVDPINTDIVLTERRLNEWVAVADDPILSVDAMQGYFEELNRLSQLDNPKTHEFIEPVIETHQERLRTAGLPGSELVSDFLALQITPSPVAVVVHTNTPVPPPPSATPQPTFTDEPAPVFTATEVPPTVTQMPTATQVPTSTQIPTATQVPTSTPVPTATQVPTSIPTDPPTAVPTEPPAASMPTESTPVETPVVPLATEVPSVPVIVP